MKTPPTSRRTTPLDDPNAPIPPAIERDWTAWGESAEAQSCFKSKTPTQRKQIRKLLELAFRAGWKIGDDQPTCFTCGGKPIRGGNGQGSALCQHCYDDDRVY